MELSCPLGTTHRFPQESHAINPLLTKLVQSKWLDIGLVLFLRVYGPRIKELGKYPAILTSRLVSNPYILLQVVPYFDKPAGRGVKVQTTSKNSQRYYTAKHLIGDLLSN